MLLYLSKVWSSVYLPKTALPLSVSTHSSTPGLSGMAATYFSPVKALVTPMPKMLKSLFPKREEKKDMTIPPLSQSQVWNHCVCITLFVSDIYRCKKKKNYCSNLTKLLSFYYYDDEEPQHHHITISSWFLASNIQVKF